MIGITVQLQDDVVSSIEMVAARTGRTTAQVCEQLIGIGTGFMGLLGLASGLEEVVQEQNDQLPLPGLVVKRLKQNTGYVSDDGTFIGESVT